MKKLIITCLASILILQAFAQTNKQNTAKNIEKKNFVFIPTRVNAYFNQPTDLVGSLYFLSVKPDTVNTFLPILLSPGKLNNTTRQEYESLKFTNETTIAKNGSWNISLNFNDNENAVLIKMYLWINKNGYGTLTINSSAEPTKIFNGYIKNVNQKSLID